MAIHSFPAARKQRNPSVTFADLGCSRFSSTGPYIKRKFEERIQKLRDRSVVKERTLADRMGVDRPYISKIESGKKNPALKVIHP